MGEVAVTAGEGMATASKAGSVTAALDRSGRRRRLADQVSIDHGRLGRRRILSDRVAASPIRSGRRRPSHISGRHRRPSHRAGCLRPVVDSLAWSLPPIRRTWERREWRDSREGEGRVRGGRGGSEGNERFRVVRSISRYHLVPDIGRIFGTWERVRSRSTYVLNARIRPGMGPTRDIPARSCNQTHP